MKKIFKVSLALLATLSLSVSCNKEINGIEDDNTITEQQGIPVTITASLSGELTKVALTQDPDNADGAVKLTWATGDKIRVASHADPTKFSELTLSSGAGDRTAEFSGELASGVVAPYDISYNSAGSSYNYAEQTQSEDANTAHLKYIATLSSVNAYADVDFTEAWAKAHGNGTFVRSSVLRLRANLPTGVAATVKSVIIRASENWVDGGNQIKVNITTPGDASSDGIINVYATLPASASTLSADATMEFIFETPEHDYLRQLTKEDIGGKTFEMGKVNAIKLNCNTVDTNVFLDDFAGGTGVEGDPWLISNPRHMVKIKDRLKDGETKYFKLINDINLADYANWTPIDASKGFINLDGNSKTISNLTFTGGDSYPGLFGILYGTVQNLTISDANISGGNKGAGILAGYLCDTKGNAIGCTIDNVTIKNSSINGNGKVCGALASSIGQNNTNTFSINISNVTVSNTSVTTTNDCGGLIAITQGASSANRTLSISHCDIINSTVSSEGSNIRVGGLVGFIPSLNTTISDIDVKGTNVSGTSKAKAVGGIVGLVSSAADFDRCTFQKNGEKTATVTGPTKHDGETSTANAFIGGISGEVSGEATFDDCHVKNATVTFTNPSENTSYWKYTGGAFGYIHSTGAKIGETTACTVETVSVPAYHYCGGFVGCLNEGSIEQSSISGLTISGRNYVGGFVGLLDKGSIEQISITGLTISGNNYVGGFVGQIDAGSISGCSVAGNTITSANATVGGFAGIINNGVFEGCSTSLSVGDDSHKMATNNGGFAGQVQGGTLEDCHASGNVFATGNYNGGFVGTGGAGTFTNCSARGTIKGSTYVAGFVGQAENETFIDCSYEGTSITATGSNKNGHVGGFVGRALTTASTFTNCHVGGGPALTISSTGAQRCGGFIGQLDGLSPVTSFSKCYVKNVNISGPANTGGFVGVQYGPIENCWVEGGSVTSVAGGNAGGFSAFIQNSGATADLKYCYTTANVDGSSFNTVGGLVGIANNSSYIIQYCYATGTVSGTGSNKGGLIGSCGGSSVTVDKCISWNSSLALIGTNSGGTVTNNYVKVASEAGTVSSHAQESPRSWSGSTWDFTGDLPTLK